MATQRTVALKVPILPHDSPEAPQPPSLKTPLYPHQLRALHRCLLVENDGSLAEDFGAFHDYRSRGGCLSDEVGMGKTATIIGLVLSSPRAAAGEGDTLVVAPGHLVRQWKGEIEKFTDEIEVLVGKREYERRATFPPEGRSHRVVLVDAETIINEEKLWYDWRRVYSDETDMKGRRHQIRVDPEKMKEYKKAALFCVKSPRGPCSYAGYVYTGPLHHPFRPWRRVIFDEIQDLVSEGTESQKNLLQLSRTAQNVWLMSATPFPHGNASVYANHELLGFCRLRLDVEVDHALGEDHPFEIIKRKLYIRSPKHVADNVVVASQRVTRDTIMVDATPLERKFFELERNGIASRNVFREDYASLRQMMVHPEASKKLREQINGRDEDQRGGKRGKAIAQKNRAVGRFATVNSFAMRSLNTARGRLRELEGTDIPNADREIEGIRSSWYLAVKVRQVRASPVQANPFARSDGSGPPPVCLETEEAKAIHQYYCRCPEYGSDTCESDDKVHFQTIGIGNAPPVWFRGYRSTQRVIDYFRNEVKQGRKIPTVAGSFIENEYLDVYINRKETAYNACVKKKENLINEKLDLQTRIRALEETVKVGGNNTRDMSEDEELAARNGSKLAALIRHLREIQERGERTIVFSYWHDTLALVHRSLKKYDLSVSFCNGRTGNQMSQAIADFTSGEVSILLLSAQAKASGTNLQCATNVVLLDPAGSSAEHGATLEQQAVGRAVRMGQERAVGVVRFCVRDTIEEELFEEIDVAAAKLATRSNDKTYVCESARGSLDEVLWAKKREQDDEVFVGESVSAKERVARTMAEARAKNEIIILDDSDDDEPEGDIEPEATLSTPKKIASTLASPVTVKPEPKVEDIVPAKRGSREVSETEAADMSPEKRPRMDSVDSDLTAPITPPIPTKRKCNLALAHEHTCQKKSSAGGSDVETNNSKMQDAPPSTKMQPPTNSNEEARKRIASTGLLGMDRQEAPPMLSGDNACLVDSEGKLHDREAECRKRFAAATEYAETCKVERLNGHDTRWLDMLLELKKVKEATGVAWVRGEKSQIGKWCKYQRRMFKKNAKGEGNTLTEGKIKLLNDIEFLWGQAEATPGNQLNKAQDEARVLSLASEDILGPPSPLLNRLSSIETQTTVALAEAGVIPAKVRSAKTFPLLTGRSDVGMQMEGAQATPDGAQTNIAGDGKGRVVSPSADQMEVSTEMTVEEDGLKGLLTKCKLGQYLQRFQDLGIFSAPQLQGKLQDLPFMQELVDNAGLTAPEAIRLQIIASQQYVPS